MSLCSRVLLFAALVLLLCATGCRSTYYAFWEKLGKEKRHLLRDQVEKAGSDQQRAAEEFKDVLTRIKEAYGLDGGDLEKFYSKLTSDYAQCEDRAEAVRARIGKVERLGGDLFKEWEQEIDQISSPELRSKSRQNYTTTQRRFERLRQAMTRAAARMDPVLTQLKDYVLYLKHNLNAQAVGALRAEADDIQLEIGRLIEDIGRSVAEAEAFVRTLE